MRSIAPAATVAALVLLGACGKHDGNAVSMTNASVDTVANVAKAQQIKLQPGQWDMTVEMVSQEIKGAPAGMPAQPKMPPVSTKICLTKEQVEKPENMFANGQADFKKNCVFDKFDMSDGKISTQMHCTMPNGMKVEGTNSGTFSATEMASESTATVSGMPGGMSSTTRTKMSARRTGECSATPTAG